MTIRRMQQRRGTAAAWTTASPVLGNGEFGYETDTQRLKVGDGVTAWASLAYFTTGSTADEYHEYANLAAFPGTGVADRIYVALDTGKFYRWTGSAYVPTSDAAVFSEGSTWAVSTAYAAGKVVTYAGGRYVTPLGAPSNTTFDASNWVLLGSAPDVF